MVAPMTRTAVVDPNLARVIEEARKNSSRGTISQLQLARATGLSLGTVRAACQGIATTRTLALLARALGVDVDALTGRRQAGVTQ